MAQIARPLLATVSLLMLWFLAFALQGLGAAVWVILAVCAVSAVNLIVLMVLFHQLTCERDLGDGGAAVPAHRPDAPDSGDGGVPSWWPDFERELEKYLAEQEQRDRNPERVPAGSVDLS